MLDIVLASTNPGKIAEIKKPRKCIAGLFMFMGFKPSL